MQSYSTTQPNASPTEKPATNSNDVEHEYPRWLAAIRVLTLTLGLVNLSLLATVLDWFRGLTQNPEMGRLGFGIFVAVFTLLSQFYVLLSTIGPARTLHSAPLILAIDTLLCILWVSVLGANAASLSSSQYFVSWESQAEQVLIGSCVVSGILCILSTTALAHRFSTLQKGGNSPFTSLSSKATATHYLPLQPVSYTQTTMPVPSAVGQTQGQPQQQPQPPQAFYQGTTPTVGSFPVVATTLRPTQAAGMQAPPVQMYAGGR